MKTGINEALLLSLAMAATIFFCRIFPFLFFRNKTGNNQAENTQNNPGTDKDYSRAFLSFVEKIVPPVAMTVLAFNSLSVPVKADYNEIIPVLAAAVFTAVVHIWRKNPLISIFGGTALYMLLIRI